MRFEDYDLDPLDIGGGVHSPRRGWSPDRDGMRTWDLPGILMEFFAEMVGSLLPLPMFFLLLFYLFWSRTIQGVSSRYLIYLSGEG